MLSLPAKPITRIDRDSEFMHVVTHAALDRGHDLSSGRTLAIHWLDSQNVYRMHREAILAAAEQKYKHCDRCVPAA